MVDEIWEDEDIKDERKKKSENRRKNAEAIEKIEDYTASNWKAS